MKLIIYLILFIMILYYLDNVETFSNTKKYHPFEFKNEVTQFDVLKSDKIKSILEYKDLNKVAPVDMIDMNMYGSLPWVVKPVMFDIFNNDPPVEKQEGKEEPKNEIKQEATSLMDKIRVINMNNMEYTLLGTASNEYYNQYFLIYENIVQVQPSQPKTSDDKFNNYINERNDMNQHPRLYRYFLGKVNRNRQNTEQTIEVIHNIGPRSKIELNDVINLSLGTFQLGPLVVKKI